MQGRVFVYIVYGRRWRGEAERLAGLARGLGYRVYLVEDGDGDEFRVVMPGAVIENPYKAEAVIKWVAQARAGAGG